MSANSQKQTSECAAIPSFPCALFSRGLSLLEPLFYFHVAFQDPIDTGLPTSASLFEVVDDVCIEPDGRRNLFRRLLRSACAAVLLEYFRSVGCPGHFGTPLVSVQLFSSFMLIVTTNNFLSQLICCNNLRSSNRDGESDVSTEKGYAGSWWDALCATIISNRGEPSGQSRVIDGDGLPLAGGAKAWR